MASEQHVAHFLHMNSGHSETSYASNSSVQGTVIRKIQPILKETIKDIANLHGFGQCFNIADLGCSSGPNTLLSVSNIIDEVHAVCRERDLKAPQFQVCLNDLYGNDFNSIFKSLPMFYASRNKEGGENFGKCFISAHPGSFHGRLFPDQSIHFFHSSSSLHWLSQVPKGLENNKLNIYIAKSSPPNVFEMYRKQFQKDFTNFLESRSSEIVHGGHMVLTFLGRSDVDPSCDAGNYTWDLLAKSLVDMVKEGLIKEPDIHLFNIPIYNPHIDEVTDLINNQGSFSIDILESFEINWDPYHNTDHANVKFSNEPKLGESIAKILRPVTEPMLVTFFGESAMDLVFQKFEKYVDEHMSAEQTTEIVIVVSLSKI